MEDNIRIALDEVIKDEIESLKTTRPENKDKAVMNLTELYRLRIDEMKNEMEYKIKDQIRIDDIERFVRDEQIKKLQIEKEQRDRYIRTGVEVAGIVLPLVFYGRWMKKGLEFEQTGTFTSKTFQGLTKLFKPTKR